MKDKFIINTDGVCVYVSVSVTNSLVGKILLLLANGIALTVLVLSVVEWIPALLLVTLVMLALLMRYTLWNLFGAENLIINTKSLSYQHDYGFWKTGYTTKDIINV